MTDVEPTIHLHDLHPEASDFLSEVREGLRAPQKTLPTKYLYDEAGAGLFERITGLQEYYPTRTERGILEASLGEMAAAIGPNAMVIEFGSGSGVKTRLLLERLTSIAAYVPVDISREQLIGWARALLREDPDLVVLPVCADFTQEIDLPPFKGEVARKVIFFPGSTIGNFDQAGARAFLARGARLVGPGGGMLIGVDLKKGAEVLEPAYDDAEGVTAAFNLNLLTRINRELGADFDVHAFRHRAIYVEEPGRIEMHLVSAVDQTVHVGGEAFSLKAGETIRTEYSYKYSLEGFQGLAQSAGWTVEAVWTDPDILFSVQYLRVAGDA